MDGSLKQYLDGLDWEALIVRLTREAGKIMAGYRWGGRTPEETRQMARDFALDTMGQAYDGCMKCLQGRFDPGRLEPGAEVDEQFFIFLRQNILRRLITDDIKKATRRSKWPIVPLDEAAKIPAEVEEAAEMTLLELVDGASDDVAKLISACVAQLECNPEQQRVNWTQIEKELNWTRYKREQMRPLLEEQLQRVVEKSSQAN